MLYRRRPKNFLSKFDIVSCFCEYEGKLLLLKRDINKPQGGTWGVPAGKVGASESLAGALLREIKEEIRVSVAMDKLLDYQKVFVRYPAYDYVYHMYRVIFNERPSIRLNKIEHSSYRWLTPVAALKLNLIHDEDSCIKLFYIPKVY